MSDYTYIPMYIAEPQEELPRNTISADQWNNLFNRLISQGDNSARALEELINNRVFQLGPQILDENGDLVADTPRIQFINSTITQDEDTTYVTVLKGDKGDKGDTGDTGPQGDVGPQGPQGNDFIILGIYETLASLELNHPTGSAGNAYLVGTTVSNTVYIWSVDDTAWVDVGPIRGPQGDTGETGPQGEIGPVGPEGPLSTIAQEHIDDAIRHITQMERDTWNSNSGLTLGETSSTAYRGDRGKVAYDHSQSAHQALITGGATTIVTSNLTANRALIANSLGKVAVSTATSTQLGFLSGVSSNIQTQLNGKLGSTAQAADSAKVGGRKITVSASAPASPAVYDVWIDV